MINLLGSDDFFSMMVVYQNGRNNQGGKPGEMLKNLNSSVWTQLKAPNNNNYNNSIVSNFEKVLKTIWHLRDIHPLLSPISSFLLYDS